jgi:hypothetical protein
MKNTDIKIQTNRNIALFKVIEFDRSKDVIYFIDSGNITTIIRA